MTATTTAPTPREAGLGWPDPEPSASAGLGWPGEPAARERPEEEGA
jgi:hypothetical protein